MAASSTWRFLAILALLVGNCVTADGNEPRYETEADDGKVVSMVFYGPATWLGNSDDGLTKFPHLSSLTLRCGKLGPDEVRHISSCRSIQEIFTAERHDSDSVEFSPGALGELSNMSWLKALSIHTDPLPEEEWRFLSSLKSLEFLVAEGMGEDAVGNIRDLERLKSLSLPNSMLQSVPQFIVGLKHLQELSITSPLNSDKVIHGATIVPLADLDSLGSLTLEGIDNLGLEHIAKIKRLQFLSLAVRDSSADLSPIGRLSELESLTLSARSLDDANFGFLATLPNLEFLQVLIGNGSGELNHEMSLRELQNLKYFIISNADCTLLNRIAELPKLERLVVRSLDGNCKAALDKLRENGVAVEVGSR